MQRDLKILCRTGCPKILKIVNVATKGLQYTFIRRKPNACNNI